MNYFLFNFSSIYLSKNTASYIDSQINFHIAEFQTVRSKKISLKK